MRQSYFLISVSNKVNLDLCVQHAMAGFMNNVSGVWTFTEIKEGDFVSFLYGARAHNLYVVEKKMAIKSAEAAPPWSPITFRQSGKTYNFPFRLLLRPIRQFDEPLVREEFAYVAENLLLRGGYRKTHFQADQTTLQFVSQRGSLWRASVDTLDLSSFPTFYPAFTKNKQLAAVPEIFRFHEFILQSLVKAYLSIDSNMESLLSGIGIAGVSPSELEILGEKAFPQGHVDLLIKEATSAGTVRRIILEVKVGAAVKKDLEQLMGYMKEIGTECIGAVLVAREFSPAIRKAAQEKQIGLAPYSLGQLDVAAEPLTFDKLVNDFSLMIV